jgi:hypothetical protein
MGNGSSLRISVKLKAREPEERGMAIRLRGGLELCLVVSVAFGVRVPWTDCTQIVLERGGG